MHRQGNIKAHCVRVFAFHTRSVFSHTLHKLDAALLLVSWFIKNECESLQKKRQNVRKGLFNFLPAPLATQSLEDNKLSRPALKSKIVELRGLIRILLPSPAATASNSLKHSRNAGKISGKLLFSSPSPPPPPSTCLQRINEKIFYQKKKKEKLVAYS